MAKKEATTDEQDLDEHGLVIHKYASTVLVVVPAKDYSETTLRYAMSALFNVHVGVWSVSTDDESLLQGEFQDEFQVNGKLSDARMEDYAGLLFCGGPGALQMADQPDAQRLAREAAAQDKLIGAWGRGVAVLAKAGIVEKRKLTGHPTLREMLEQAGARYSGTQVQRDGKLVTALDDAAGLRFGKTLVEVVRI